jgi:hypothetical protein
MVYTASGIGFIVLGALRVNPLTDTLRQAFAVSLVFAGVALTIVLAIMAVLFWLPGTGRVAFFAAVQQPAQDSIVVTCRNNSTGTAAIYLPWPDVVENRRPRGGTDNGVDVYVRENGREEFRLLPNTRAAWSLPGGLVLDNSPLFLTPGMTAQYILDLRELMTSVANADMVRLTFSRGNGHSPGTFDAALPKHNLPPRPAKARARPSSGQSISAPKPSPITPAQQQTARSARLPVTRTTITFTGMLGEKAILRIETGSENAADRQAVDLGATVVDGWVLETIQQAPSAVVLRNEAVNARITVNRGKSADLGAAH